MYKCVVGNSFCALPLIDIHYGKGMPAQNGVPGQQGNTAARPSPLPGESKQQQKAPFTVSATRVRGQRSAAREITCLRKGKWWTAQGSTRGREKSG